jgi:hypothetical protein
MLLRKSENGKKDGADEGCTSGRHPSLTP